MRKSYGKAYSPKRSREGMVGLLATIASVDQVVRLPAEQESHILGVAVRATAECSYWNLRVCPVSHYLRTGMAIMTKSNGIILFSKGDTLPELPSGLSDYSPTPSQFGYRIVEQGGTPSWEPATEADYRASEAQRLGVSPEEVKLSEGCHQTSPQSCAGFCTGPNFCTLAYNPQGHYYYCICT